MLGVIDDDLARLRARPGASGAPVGLPEGALLRDLLGAGPFPLVVLFHGAGSTAHAGLRLLSEVADDMVLLAPQSFGSTWDGVRGGFDLDVERLDEALAAVFARCPIDPMRVALGGFSDGASYALSLGLGNGDLITHIIAFSPGFAAPVAQRGRPRILITHGLHDPVLPIDRCSRRLVPKLRRAGYDVTYEEFDGGHTVTPEHARHAADWLRS
jgi:phospholipase/carboxylesterase